MTKEEKEREPKSRFEKLAQTPPVLPVISDHPLDRENAFDDRFDLCLRLGPVFDIIRHSKTPTPTAIAIYGDWGTGKTSSMKWLEGLINEWNKNGKAEDKTTIRTVWFYPWKYHDKDDVWRGLISEVILKGTEIKGADTAWITKTAKQFGPLLGKGFMHALAALKLKVGGGSIPVGAELELSFIKDIISEYDKTIHPEKAFLNEFENSFEQWLKKAIGDDERMVIFIDDLDRCMPQVALKVLEALKLYLNIKQLIFVVGVDKDVIKPLVKKHYEDLGLKEDKSDNYLAKMFQTEVTVGPSEQQVVDYLNYHLDNVKYFQPPYLKPSEKQLFRYLINKLADRNPREVKRLINSAVMSGAGIEMLKKAGDGRSDYSFKQGLQVFFIRKILESKEYDKPRLLGSNRGSAFFSEWSQIVCTNIKEDENFPLTITVPEDYQQILLKYRDIKDGSIDQVSEQMKKRALAESPPDIPMAYYKFIKNPHYSDLLILLADERLGQLMQIEFSAEIAEITKEAEPAPKKEEDATIIRNAIAKYLGKEPDALEDEDYDSVKELSLYGEKITDITLLKRCKNLRTLHLSENSISDISALKGLKNLTSLLLDNNQISDISMLKGLTNLTVLYLHGNQISDISALKGLTKLILLDLNYTKVNDLTPIRGLGKLTHLYVSTTQFDNIQAVSELTNLRLLGITNTKVGDLEPIKDLINLEALYFSGTPVKTLEPLKGLKTLRQLSFRNTEIDTLEPLKELTGLQTLKIQNTLINSLEPLKGLINLKKLYIEGCENITTEQIDELQKALPDCEIPAALIKESFIINRQWRLFFNPKVPGLSKTKVMRFGQDGVILEGQNNNESSWRLRYGYFEMLDSNGQVHSRFYYDPDNNQFSHTNDPDTGSIRKHSIRDQYMLPE